LVVVLNDRLFQDSPVATAVVGLDGRIVEANTALHGLLGFGGAALVGHRLTELTHADDIAKSASLIKRLLLGEIHHFECDQRYLRMNGSELIGHLIVSLVTDETKKPLAAIGVIEDVTERSRELARMKDNGANLHMALDAARMATWEFDTLTQHVKVSENFNEILGLTPNATDGSFPSFLRYVHEDDVAQFAERIRSADSGNEFALDCRFNSPLRGLRIVHNRGRLILGNDGEQIRCVGVVMDVTSSRGAERRSQESEAVFRRTIEATTDAFIGIGSDGIISDWNMSAERTFGWSALEAIGQSIDLVMPLEFQDHYHEKLALSLQHAHMGELVAGPLEFTGQTRDGRRIPVEVTVVGVERDDHLTFHAFVRDITARKTAEENLTRQAFTDDQTGLPNRALLQVRIANALARVQLDGVVAVLVIDIDHLKVVNDSLGHQAGDEVLIAVAERVAAVIRPDDTLARFAGDQFVVLVEHFASTDEALALAQRVLNASSEPLDIDGHQLRPGVSIGVAMLLGVPANAVDLLRDADLAMYRAKGRGGQCVELFDVAMREEAFRQLNLERELRIAIDDDQLRIHYQPVFTADGEMVSVEALVRWEHPDQGLLFPDDFIPLAEQSGLIVDLGQWVLKEACRQTAAWRLTGAPRFSMAVNLSTRQLLQPDLCAIVSRTLSDEHLSPIDLCLELTESALLDDSDQAWMTLVELRDMGVEIAIDDFGTGYSSLTYLRRFPVQILKLDRSFVHGLADSSEDAAIVGSTIQLAHALGLKAVAEGVENSAQRDALQLLECDFMQGFLWSPALPPALFEAKYVRATAALPLAR
jgi:diguanylate cyclase (GGDEF)-like protein/PAS domain S-box-containing protein